MTWCHLPSLFLPSCDALGPQSSHWCLQCFCAECSWLCITVATPLGKGHVLKGDSKRSQTWQFQETAASYFFLGRDWNCVFIAVYKAQDSQIILSKMLQMSLYLCPPKWVLRILPCCLFRDNVLKLHEYRRRGGHSLGRKRELEVMRLRILPKEQWSKQLSAPTAPVWGLCEVGGGSSRTGRSSGHTEVHQQTPTEQHHRGKKRKCFSVWNLSSPVTL